MNYLLENFRFMNSPLMLFVLLQSVSQHPTACAQNETDKQCERKKSRKQTNSKPQTEKAMQADVCLASH